LDLDLVTKYISVRARGRGNGSTYMENPFCMQLLEHALAWWVGWEWDDDPAPAGGRRFGTDGKPPSQSHDARSDRPIMSIESVVPSRPGAAQRMHAVRTRFIICPWALNKKGCDGRTDARMCGNGS
jgi:hypothetical protein